MACAPLAVQPVTATQEVAVAIDTRGPAPVTPGQDPSNAAVRLLRRAAAAVTRGNHLRHAINRTRQLFMTSYHDPKFQRPDVVEDDYFRFRHQPREY